MTTPGLYLVGTPLGNLDELTPRAATILGTADPLLCEDTRTTLKLLRAVGIPPPPRLWAYHEHNEDAQRQSVLAELRAGHVVAMVSEAGLPLISDPGYPLVAAAAAEGLPIFAVGAGSAVAAALLVSGLPPVPFAFFGFPPAKAGGRRSFADRIAAWPHTAVLYISPHRGADELATLAAACGTRDAALVRELTKRHETVYRAELPELATRMAADSPKGEWSLVIGPAAAEPEQDETARIAAAIEDAQALVTEEGLPAKAAAMVAAARAVPELRWRQVYKPMLKEQP